MFQQTSKWSYEIASKRYADSHPNDEKKEVNSAKEKIEPIVVDEKE